MENSTNPIVPATPPETPPENQDNKPGISKSVIISVLAVVIIGGSFMFFGSGNQYQGLIRAKDQNSRVTTQVDQPVPRGVIPRGKKPATTTTATPSTDEEAAKAVAEAKKKADEEAKKAAEEKAAEEAAKVQAEAEAKKAAEEEAAKANVTPIFDASTMNIIYTPKGGQGTATTMYFKEKDSEKDIQYSLYNNMKLIFPTYNTQNTEASKPQYSQAASLQFCKTDLSQCTDVSSGTYDIMKNPTYKTKSTEIPIKNAMISGAVSTLGLSNNETIAVRYKLADPAGIDVFSTVLTLQIAKKEFDESTMDISRVLIYDQKDINVINYNYKDQTNATGTDFDLTLPKWKNGIPQTISYSTFPEIELCTADLGNCIKIEISPQIVYMDKGQNKTIGVSGKQMTEAINKLDIKHGDQGAIRYKIQDPGETTYTSKAITFTFIDYQGELILPEGKTLFDTSTMSISHVELIDIDGAQQSAAPINYDSRIKGITGFDFFLPTFSLSNVPNGKYYYDQPAYLKICNAGLTSCKTINELEVRVWNQEGKSTGNVTATQKTHYSSVDSEKIKSLLKELITPYDGKFFFIFSIKDPSGTELTTSNSIELLVDDYDKAAALAGPITGDIIDENTFKIINIINILGDDDLTVEYQLPTLKPSFDLTDQHLVSVTLEYCKPDFSSCVDVKKENTVTVYKKYNYADSPGLRYRSIFVNKTDKATIKNANPDKSLYRLKMESPENSTIYAIQ